MNPSKYRKRICCTWIASPRLYDSKGPGTCWSSNGPHRWPGCPGTACQIWTSANSERLQSVPLVAAPNLYDKSFLMQRSFFLQPPGDSKWPFWNGDSNWPFKGWLSDLQLRDKKVTNWITWQPSVPFAFLPKSHAISLLLMQIQWHGGMARFPLIFWPNCVTLLHSANFTGCLLNNFLI